MLSVFNPELINTSFSKTRDIRANIKTKLKSTETTNIQTNTAKTTSSINKNNIVDSPSSNIIDTVEWGGAIVDDKAPLSILKPPTRTGQVNSPFGYRDVPGGTASINISQKTGKQINFGADFFGQIGDPALASADAIVESATPNAGLAGNQVKLKFDLGGETYYMDYNHLDSINVKPGQEIKAGTPIGTIGNTGNTTGPHLDWSVYKVKNGTRMFIDTSSIFGR